LRCSLFKFSLDTTEGIDVDADVEIVSIDFVERILGCVYHIVVSTTILTMTQLQSYPDKMIVVVVAVVVVVVLYK
jgi:hypothetical protein